MNEVELKTVICRFEAESGLVPRDWLHLLGFLPRIDSEFGVALHSILFGGVTSCLWRGSLQPQLTPLDLISSSHLILSSILILYPPLLTDRCLSPDSGDRLMVVTPSMVSTCATPLQRRNDTIANYWDASR